MADDDYDAKLRTFVPQAVAEMQKHGLWEGVAHECNFSERDEYFR